MAYRLKHKVRYIPWHKMPKMNVSDEQFTEIFKSLDPKKRFTGFYTKRSSYEEGSWTTKRLGLNRNIYIRKNGRYLHYWSHIDNHKNYDGNKEKKKYLGRAAISTVNSMFEEKNNVTLKGAFGYSPIEVKLMCSPKQFYYTNDKYFNKELLSVSMADFTSHYPASAAGQLPDYRTAKTVQGTVKPTKEWPFALYIKSGHIAEYGVFDSHDWVNHKLFDRLFVFHDEYRGSTLVHKAQHPFLNPDEDETILMKASAYELGDIYAELYAKRKENEEFKNAMNKSIGYMATCVYSSFRLAHIRAFIIGRANAKMLKVVDEVGLKPIIQICVDGVAYIGSSTHGLENKTLGSLHQEFSGAKGIFRELNCYIIEQDDKIIKVKHACYNACEGGDIDNPTSLQDINKWYRTPFIEEEEDE